MLTAILLVLAGLALIGVGITLYARRRRRASLPPVGLDIPSREELPYLLKVCIAATLSKVETSADKRFLAGAVYWKCKDDNMSDREALVYAIEACDAVLEIRMVE